tara:strand:- start:1272 stop:1577 length:306 start_codon:yes stop_codon:yes gene_type:complete
MSAQSKRAFEIYHETRNEVEEIKCCICGKNASHPDYAPVEDFHWITVRPFRRIPPRHWYDYDNSLKIFCKDCISPVVCLSARPAQVARINSQGSIEKIKWE